MPQVTVGTTATRLTPNTTGPRKSVIIQNHGSTPVFIGYDDDVTAENGFRLPGVDGASLTLDSTAQVWAIVETGSQDVSVLEVTR